MKNCKSIFIMVFMVVSVNAFADTQSSNTEIPEIYFLEGHGERNLLDFDSHGYSKAKEAIESQGYDIASLNLAKTAKVPENAKTLLLAGPKSELFPQETKIINDYLNKGGSVMILIDPIHSPSMDSFLKDWGIQADNNLVLDVSGIGRMLGKGPSIIVVTKYEEHEITWHFSSFTFFPQTRSIRVLDFPPKGITVETLFKSNPQSWGETNLEKDNAQFNPNVDLKGPLSIAVAAIKEIEAPTLGTHFVQARMVVVGTSIFADNDNFAEQGNGNLFLNMINWLARDNDPTPMHLKGPLNRTVETESTINSLFSSDISTYDLGRIFGRFAIGVMILGIPTALIARRKGFKPFRWFVASGLIGLIVVACISSANAKNISLEESQHRAGKGNKLGAILASICIGFSILAIIIGAAISS